MIVGISSLEVDSLFEGHVRAPVCLPCSAVLPDFLILTIAAPLHWNTIVGTDCTGSGVVSLYSETEAAVGRAVGGVYTVDEAVSADTFVC